VIGGEQTPPSGGDNNGSNTTGGGGAGREPLTTRSVLGVDQVSHNWKVILTNLLLAIILLVILFTSSAVFNETISEHRALLQGWLQRTVGPLVALAGGVSEAWSSRRGLFGLLLERLLGPMLVLGLAALIYTFGNSGMGWNSQTALLYVSMILTMAIMTYLSEGGEALITHRRYGVSAAVRLYPFALIIAIVFTLLTRVINFQAPVMFGFIATATALTTVGLEEREGATAVLVPSLALLALSVGCWFAIDPLRDAVHSSNWWASLPSATASLIFVGGIEGLLFVMIPLSFTDGSKLFKWYRPFWLLIVVISAFFFSWAILNPAAVAFDIFLERRVLFVVSSVAAYATLALLVWAYFKARATLASEEA
jgi:hypothetical protein